MKRLTIKELIGIGLFVSVGLAALPTGYRVFQAVRLYCKGAAKSELRTWIETVCNRNFAFHNCFVEISGSEARILNRRIVNETVRLDNGFLTYERSTTPTAAEVREFVQRTRDTATFLQGQNIRYLFVLAPYKMDLAGTMLPPTADRGVLSAARQFVELLRKEKVDVLDLRETFAQTPELVERYFYRTDHHWNGDAFFEASDLVARTIAQTNQCCLRRDDWTRYTRENWFIGSLGRRTGRVFAGLDDLIWYEPKFKTDITCDIPERNHHRQGDFNSAVLVRSYLGPERPNLWTTCAYDCYLGVGGGFVSLTNASAPHREKVLLVMDSFGRPVQALLSTVFNRVDAFDPRLCKVEQITDYIAKDPPDIVVSLMNSGGLQNKDLFPILKGCDVK